MALSPAKQQLFNIAKKTYLENMNEAWRTKIAPLQQQLGMRSPEIAAQAIKTTQDATQQINKLFADLGITQEEEQREERLIGEERAYSDKKTRAEWRNQYKNMMTEIGANSESQKLGFQEQEKLANLQRKWELDDRKYAEKKAKEDMWANIGGTALKVGVNAATGGVLAPMAGMTFGQGLLTGGAGVAQYGMQKNLIKNYLDKGGIETDSAKKSNTGTYSDILTNSLKNGSIDWNFLEQLLKQKPKFGIDKLSTQFG